VIGLLLYRSRSGIKLNVTPDAEREIEKAKRAVKGLQLMSDPMMNSTAYV